MEVSLMSPKSTVAKSELFSIRNPVISGWRRRSCRPSRVWFASASRSCRKAAIRAVSVRSETAVEGRESPVTRKPGQPEPVELFVGLPLDAVSDRNTVNHAKAIAAGLRALKLLGANGVELPVWWGVAQAQSPAQFEWAGYLALARAAGDAGLKLRVSLRLHGSPAAAPLPAWIERIAAADPNILFADRAGRRHPGCLSFAADELPVLDGVTPMQAFEEFFLSFKSAFAEFIGSAVTDISIGLGPDGELRYPSFSKAAGSNRSSGVGEFQCYDKYMLDSLKSHAEAAGNPMWGLSGPHDTPEYSQSPDSTSFFRDNGGSWESPYGKFFLSWYSGQLLAHGDRLLALASKVFGDSLKISAKVPLVHWCHDTRSRPAQLTAGFYNPEGSDGYDAVAEIFARNSCSMILPGVDLAGRGPESLLGQITEACKRHGVAVSGENSSITASGLGRIKENLSGVDSFTYQRMGAYFFSPEHWPRFVEFVRGLALPELEADDLASEEGARVSLPMGAALGREREMQAV